MILTQKVHDEGFAHLVDMMGDDNRVLDAARVSTGASSKGTTQDRKLIEYLMKNRHHTPFEKIVFEWHIKCPIFVARQWFRHRIGSFNEVSGRYKEFQFEAYVPEEWRAPGATNHQGSVFGMFTDEQQREFFEMLDEAYSKAKHTYFDLLNRGVAKELARLVLPMAQYTEFYWTVNMRSFMNFISLRDDAHAQWEIRQYAKAMREMITRLNRIPLSWGSFEKYGYGA